MYSLENILNNNPEMIFISATLVVLAPITYYFFKLLPQGLHEQPTVSEASPAKTVETSSNKPLLSRISTSLSKTRNELSSKLQTIFTKGSIDDELLEQLHETLYRADVGVESADILVEAIKKRFGKDTNPSWKEVREVLVTEIESIISIPKKNQPPLRGPKVILVIGVNGVGKTTTIGKLASKFAMNEQDVLLCAADTYRAAAIDQLAIWGDRLGVDVIKHKPNADPAAVAYDAAKAANSRGVDTLIVDTAGRLHTKNNLMDELAKIKRVLGKDIENAPHDTWLVIDATTGQNAIQQIQAFREVAQITGLIVTKLDGTAKGGIIISAIKKFGLPVKYVGLGEQASDLKEFDPKSYAESIIE